MHVTYPRTEPKSRFKYYVGNNRDNHKSCAQDYIRADILEASVIREIGKLAERKDIIAALVADYVEHNRKALPELEQNREAIRRGIASLGPEKQKLSRWLRGQRAPLQVARFVDAQIDELSEQETRLQEQQWGLEDQINELQKESYNARGIAGQLKGFVQSFPQRQAGEGKLLVDALIERVEIGQNSRVVAVLRPPLLSFGYLSPSLAPKEDKAGRRCAFSLLFDACIAQLPRCDSNHLGLTISRFQCLETLGSCLSPVTTYLAEPAIAHAKNLSSSGSLQTGSGKGGAWTISAPTVSRSRILATSTPENFCANSSATRLY
jgi:hypothetical protein